MKFHRNSPIMLSAMSMRKRAIRRIVLACVMAGLAPNVSPAQSVVQPEQCVLDTLKGSSGGANITAIRYSCVRLYIKSVEPNAVEVPVSNFSSAQIFWQPINNAILPPSPEEISVKLRNDSTFTLISLIVIISDKKTNSAQTYKLYAKYPVAPNAAGDFWAEALTGATQTENFWETRQWNLIRVFGVSP